jgi:hypothetical protein
MTESTTEDQDLSIALSGKFRSGESGEVELRQIALGLTPSILIEVDVDSGDENTMPVSIDSTGFTPEELADFLEMLSEAVRQGVIPALAAEDAEN